MVGTMNQSAKMENEEIESEETPTAQENIAPTTEVSGELNAPRWSVVSFEKCIASNLTYRQASDKLNELNAEKVSGLCIVTDEAAERVGSIGGQ